MLVVEDVALMREWIVELVQKALRNSGVDAQVYGAGHLADARRWMHRHWPDRVLLDVTLGLESGLDLLPEFRARQTPVWVLAAEAWPFGRELPPGVQGVWRKPQEGRGEWSAENIIQRMNPRSMG